MIEPSTIVVEGSGADVAVLRRKVAQTTGKVTEHFDELRFNTAVAALMELANTMQDHLQRGGARDPEWDGAVRTLIKLLNPLAPHVAEEMWERIGGRGMVGGKLRDRLTVDAGLAEAAALEAAMRSEKVRAALNGGAPSKIVYVQDRLINLVP